MSFYLISENPHGDVGARIMRKNEAHDIERPISGVDFLSDTYTWLISVGVRDDVKDLRLGSNGVTFTR
jgi:hypothetical protein